MEKIKTAAKIVFAILLIILFLILCFLDFKAALILLGVAGIWSIAQTLDERLGNRPIIKVYVTNKIENIDEDKKDS